MHIGTILDENPSAVLVESEFLTESERNPCHIINEETGNIIESPFRNSIEAGEFLSFYYPGILADGLKIVPIED